MGEIITPIRLGKGSKELAHTFRKEDSTVVFGDKRRNLRTSSKDHVFKSPLGKRLKIVRVRIRDTANHGAVGFLGSWTNRLRSHF